MPRKPMLHKQLSRLAAAMIALLALGLPALAEGIEVHDAYVRTAYPGAPSAAAFMVILNPGGPDDHLVAARSPVAARVELHTHEDAGDGVMRMRHLPEGLALPSDSELLLERGGHHVMLMGVTEPFAPGDTVAITLVFRSGTELTLDVEVRDDDPARQMDHGQMEHGSDGN